MNSASSSMPASESYAYTIMTFFGMLLVLLPLPWHYAARNSGTLLYIAWTFTGNLIYFVNSIVWRGNMGNPAPVWCDISTKIAMGLGVAYPACALCINRRLFLIATSRHASSSPSEKRNQILIDLSIGLGIPVLIMALHIVVQGHRYDIYEDVGCWPTVYSSVLSIILISIWPSILGLISIVYCLLSIRAFLKQRRTFRALVGRNSNSLNFSRYFRLMALAGTDIALSVPLSLYILSSNLKDGLQPWISWSYVHWGFSETPQVPVILLKEGGAWPAVEINRWASPVLAIIFFAFFGLAGETLQAYKRIIARVSKPITDRVKVYLPWKRFQGDRAFDGGVTLPSTPGAAMSPGWQSKSKFTEPPTPVSALKSSSRALEKKKADVDELESGLDYYFADSDEQTLHGDSPVDLEASPRAFVAPPALSLPPRAASRSASPSATTNNSLRGDKPLPSSPVIDVRRLSAESSTVLDHSTLSTSHLAPPARTGDESGSSSALPSASSSSAFPLDLSSFPIPASLPSSYQSNSLLSSSYQSNNSLLGTSYNSFQFVPPPSFPFGSSSLLTPASLNGQFRNSFPARYSFFPSSLPSGGLETGISMIPLADAGARMGVASPLGGSGGARHSYAGPASPREHDVGVVERGMGGMGMGMRVELFEEHGHEDEELPEDCYGIFPPTPMAL